MPVHHLNPLTTSFDRNKLPPSSPLDSPPSLTYSEFSDASEVNLATFFALHRRDIRPDREQETVTATMSSMSVAAQGQRQDASLVVQQVLGKLDHVVEHVSRFRKYEMSIC
jgi:hypothetical protein